MNIEKFMEQERQAAYEQIGFQIERLEMMGVDKYFIEQSLSYKSDVILDRYDIKEMEDKFEDCVRECPSVDSNIQPMDDPDDYMGKVDEAGYGDEEYTAEEMTNAAYHALREIPGLVVTKKGDTEVVARPIRPKFVDDGLHQGQSVEYWEGSLKHLEWCYDNTIYDDFVTIYIDSGTEICVAALASAIAFRDGDIEGYRAMHGGV